MGTTFTRLSTVICYLLIIGAIASCKNEALIRPGDTLPEAFKKAMTLYQGEKYGDAAEALETVINLGRGTEYGQEAQYYLAESYMKQGRYLLAASEYERYYTLFPRSDRRPEVQFKEAYSYYQLSPRYKLDQTYTRRAIEKFRIFNSRYPESDRVGDAAEYIDEMRTKLAKKHYYAGDLYLRTDRYQAAIVYFDLTIDNYPETIWAQRALVDEIKTYNTFANRSVASRQVERYEKAVDSYEKFMQLFPNGEYRPMAEDYVDEARSALADLRENLPDTVQISTSSGNE